MDPLSKKQQPFIYPKENPLQSDITHILKVDGVASRENLGFKIKEDFCIEQSDSINLELDGVIDKVPSSKETKILLKFLLSIIDLKPRNFSWKLVKAVLIKKDKEILKESREVLQEIFTHLIGKARKSTPNSSEEKLYELLIADLLTLYPFFEAHYEKEPHLQVPQKINGEWKLIQYAVEPIRLSKKWMHPPLYAYGLLSQEKEAPPLLLFMGTPPPTTTGETIAKWVDFIPGKTVGEELYNMSKEVIGDWIEESYKHTGKPVQTYGKSLGGAMCLLTSLNWGDKTKAFAFNPPGLNKRMYNQFKKNLARWRAEKGDDFHPEINIFSQKNDIVSELFGKWPPKTQFYKIIPEKKTNIYYAHIQTFLSGKKIKVLRFDPKTLNKEKKRKFFSIAFQVIAAVFFPFNSLGLLFSSAKYAVKKHTFTPLHKL